MTRHRGDIKLLPLFVYKGVNMADTIKIKAGKGSVPTLADREIAYSRDEKALYIGTPNGNVKVSGGGGTTDLSAIQAEIDKINAAITAINARLDAM